MVVCYVFRLERLQRIVSKVQMESGVCEEQLNQVETLLQTVRYTYTLNLDNRNLTHETLRK